MPIFQPPTQPLFDKLFLNNNFVGRSLSDTAIWPMIRSTPAWGFGLTGSLEETAIDTLRWDFDPSTRAPRGVAFAGARTNFVTNPRAEGAVAGTPGTNPTGWGTRPTGVTSEIIGATTVNGIPGLVFRLVGTPSSTVTQSWNISTTNTVTVNDTVCVGGYFAILAGSMTNITQFWLRSRSSDAGVVVSTGASATPQYRERRWVATAGTSIQPQLAWAFADTVTPVDITVFIGAVQQRLTIPFVDDIILPPVGTPGNSTRAQGNVTIPVAQLGTRWNRRAGVLICDWNSQPGPFTSAADADWFGLVSWGNATANERLGIICNPAHNTLEARVTAGGTPGTASAVSITAPAAGVTTKVAMAWDLDAGFLQIASRGVAGSKVALNALPLPGFIMPGRFGTSHPLFGRIAQLNKAPIAVFDSALASLT